MQVTVFADRLEIWNPGELALADLRLPHASIPRTL